jgi:DnaJ-domain-containing protein 1
MARQVREDGWWSDDGMAWHHPAPDASAPAFAVGFKTASIASRQPVIIPNPIEAHIEAIREAYRTLDAEHGVAALTIAGLRRELEAAAGRAAEAKARYERAEAKLQAIRGHL